ncbi:WD40-repeat-containing domain protein [Catenaria anguillulae PL171]|uniref:WD40-repeat-containing domain protein n=1 Tax=Catenaria anguillulae PL171 TaxID=765915 RepID=A0A1Y2HAC9_9FUNG|nr:WD40-repeat-containing domain protein [Catenaria anguillulae PL171]
MFPRQLGADESSDSDANQDDDDDNANSEDAGDSDFMDEDDGDGEDDDEYSDEEYDQDPTLSLTKAQKDKIHEDYRVLKAANAAAGCSLLLAHEIARVADPTTSPPWWACEHLSSWHSHPNDQPASPTTTAPANRKRKLSISSASSASIDATTTPRRRTSVSSTSSNSLGAVGGGFMAMSGGVVSHNVPGYRGIQSIRALRGRQVGGHAFQASPEFQVLPMSRLLPNTRGRPVLHYDARPYSGQFSADGNFFYVCTQDFRVHMYDSRDPLDLREYKTVRAYLGQWTITDATLTTRNDRIAYSTIMPHVHVASTDPDAAAEEQTRLDLSGGRGGGAGRFGIWSLRFSADGRELVAGTSANSVIVYDVERKVQVLSARGHVDDVNAVCFADQSTNVMYSGSDDSLIKVWDRRSLRPGDSARPVGVLPGHTEGITYVSSRGDGRYLVSNGKDQCAKLWDVRKMVMPSTFDKMAPDMRDLRLDWDYRWQAFPLGAHGPAVRRHPNDASVVTFMGHHSVSKGSVVVYNMLGQCVREMRTGSLGQVPSMHGSWRRENVVRDVAWHPNMPIIMATTWTGDGGAVARHDYAPTTFGSGDCDSIVTPPA